MQKAIIVALLISVLTGGAFAQISFSGEVHAGIQLQRLYGESATISTTHREYGAPMFDFTATVFRENYGARLDTTSQMTGGTAGGLLTLNGIYGWVNFNGFFGSDSFRLTMGKISSPVWVTRLDMNLPEFRFDEGIRGFRLEYATPLQGLSIGAAFRTEEHNIQRFAEQMILGANFVHPVFSAVVAYDLGRDANLLFGFNFTGLPDLTAGFQLQAENLAIWNDSDFVSPGILRTYYKVGYRIMRSLNVYVIFGQRIFARSGMVPEWVITPGITYRFLPELTGDLRVSLDNYEGASTMNLTVITALEYTLRGPAIFYVEYQVNLADMARVSHTFGFGMTIRTF